MSEDKAPFVAEGKAAPMAPPAAVAAAAGAAPADPSLFPSQQDLNDANQAWADGRTEDEKGQPVGDFPVLIEAAELGRSASSDRLQIKYKLTILSGQYKDVSLFKYDGLDKAQTAKITQQQLARLGVDIKSCDNVAKLPAILLQLVGKQALIKTKRNGQFFNIYFQKLLTGNTAGAGPSTAGTGFASAAAGATNPARRF